MTTRSGKTSVEQRGSVRLTLHVPFRLVTSGRAAQTVDGETLDVSAVGVGVKIGRGKPGIVDNLLESLVEDRLTVEVSLRLPQGSVRGEGQVMWWGVLGGDEDRLSLRAGILLSEPWSDADWKLIEASLESS